MYRQTPTPSHLLLSAVNGMVRAHEKSTGRRAWEVSISQLPHRAVVRLVVEGAHVVGLGTRSRPRAGFFGGSEEHGVLFLLDYLTGRAIWNIVIPGPIFLPTLLVEAPHVFLANGATLTAFAFDDGRILWSDASVGEVWTSRGVPFSQSIALATPTGSAQGDG